MNVLFLGNGFDLHHHLPTKYINFLNTIDSLSQKEISSIKTIDDVFGDEKLREKDKEIRESYDQYKEIYKEIQLDSEALAYIKNLSENNVWCKYLLGSVSQDITWIDFEKEIADVIRSFQNCFSHSKRNVVDLGKLAPDEWFRINKFDFFLLPDGNNDAFTTRTVKAEYTMNYPAGSRNKIIDKSEIIKELLQQLDALAKGLKVYLMFFIEKTVEKIQQTADFPWKSAFNHVDHVITFNYTNTYEILYGKGTVTHIHGNVKDKIILGTNPDDTDKLETIDTSFIYFKKYFQRLLYKTDLQYLNFIKENDNKGNEIALYVIGHSLNVTDKDIIQDFFKIADKIYILNYDENDEMKHISNLIDIYAKEGFDKIRREKYVRFISIKDDITNLLKQNSIEATHKHNMEMISALASHIIR